MGFSAVSLIVSTLRMSIPLLIAGMGSVYASRSGMMAMGVESMMLFGAFGGVFTSYFTGNVLLGFLTGMVCGAAHLHARRISVDAIAIRHRDNRELQALRGMYRHDANCRGVALI